MNEPRRRKAANRPNNRRRTPSGRDFWGTDPDDDIDVVRPSYDPGALIWSLGPPPLPSRETAAEYHFALVYEKAAALAIALAAASDLLAPADDDD